MKSKCIRSSSYDSGAIELNYLSRLDDRMPLVNGGKAFPVPIQRHIKYRFLEAFRPTRYNVAESDIDQYFDTATIGTEGRISQS